MFKPWICNVYLITSFSQSITAVRAGTNVLFIHSEACIILLLREDKIEGKVKESEGKRTMLPLAVQEIRKR